MEEKLFLAILCIIVLTIGLVASLAISKSRKKKSYEEIRRYAEDLDRFEKIVNYIVRGDLQGVNRMASSSSSIDEDYYRRIILMASLGKILSLSSSLKEEANATAAENALFEIISILNDVASFNLNRRPADYFIDELAMVNVIKGLYVVNNKQASKDLENQIEHSKGFEGRYKNKLEELHCLTGNE